MSPPMALCRELQAGGASCGWSVVQLDHDEEMGPMHGMYGTLDTEFEVQRTIKRAEWTAFLSSQKGCWSHHNSCRKKKGIIDGLWKRHEVHWSKSEGC